MADNQQLQQVYMSGSYTTALSESVYADDWELKS